jgi:uncharacterized membrane protein
MRLFHRFARSRTGSVAVMFAAALPALVGFAAFAVDLGSVYLTSRQLQGVADLAAMAAARDMTDATAAANATVQANTIGAPVSVALTPGVYDDDPSVTPSARFTPGGAQPTAIKVTLTTTAPLYFGQLFTGKSGVQVTRTATAARADFASFQIGSSLAALQGGMVNALLSALTGSTVNLTVMDQNALVGANVDLFQYMSALQTRLSLQAASFSNVLSTQASTGTALSALVDALSTSGQTQAAAAAAKIASAAGQNTPVDMTDLLDLGPYGAQDHVSANSDVAVSVNALDLASAVLTAAEGGRQVQMNLGATVPGLTNLTAYVAIGQRASNSPWLAIDDAGAVTVRTAQARLYLDAQVGGGGGVLQTLGISVIDVPVYVELAQAQATLASLSCGTDPSQETVALSVQPSLGQLSLGTVNTATLSNFAQAETVSPATLVNLMLVQATASSTVTLGGGVWQSVTFDASDISNGVVKTVQTNTIASATLSSLLGNTQVGLRIGGLAVTTGPAASALQSALAGAGAPLDQVVDGLTGVLGVHLGEAQVKIDGLRCNDAALVA